MTAGPIQLWSQQHGDADDPAVVVISGLGQQSTAWPMGFVHGIVIGGYRVIRFDNRDIGRSDRHPSGKIKLGDVVEGDPRTAPYTLESMADDTIRLVDRLGLARVHVVGYSMGGMIAQLLAGRFPKRILSLVSLMSTTGAQHVGRATTEGERVLYAPLPLDPDAAIAQTIEDRAVWTTGERPPDAAERAWIGYEYHRGYDAAGVGRQIGAIRANGDRTRRLGRIIAPTLVIHGTEDPLIDVSGGRATAAAIPHASYLELEGIAHDLGDDVWPLLLGPMHRLWRNADGVSPPAG